MDQQLSAEGRPIQTVSYLWSS